MIRKWYLGLLVIPLLGWAAFPDFRVRDSVWLLPSCKPDVPLSAALAMDVAPGEFTLAVIPDTQAYCRDHAILPFGWPAARNPRLEAAAEWIIAHQKPYNVAFVTHVGDVVDKNIEYQWKAAEQQLDRIIAAGMPLGISVGNHDMEARDGTSELFQSHFPRSKFESFPWYGGDFPGSPLRPGYSGNNANSFQLITAGGQDLLLLHLECNAPDEVLGWARDVLTRHADRMAVVINHMWLGPVELPKTPEDFLDAPKGRTDWLKCHKENGGNTAQQIYDKLISKHGNIALVLSGDQRRTQAMAITSAGDAGNTIHELMLDHGNGRYIRLLKFDPQGGEVEFLTWDLEEGQPLLGTSRVKDPAAWQGRLPINLRLEARPGSSG